MGYIGQFDQAVLAWVEKLPASLRPFMIIVTNVGAPIPCALILLAAIIWMRKRNDKPTLTALRYLIIAMPLSMIFKEVIRRVRPNTAYVHSMIFKSYSFPSGHAYSSFLVYGFFVYLVWNKVGSAWKWPAIAGLILMIILVGISRIYLGAHFPSDVLGGWVLGIIVLSALIKFCLKSPTKARSLPEH